MKKPSKGKSVSTERLQKVMASAGVGSRRACEELIRQGRVKVDGELATLGCKVDPRRQRIFVDGRLLRTAEKIVHVALHKPPGILSVMRDDRGRPALQSLVDLPTRLYPVGRLDAESEGLVLLTNDGPLAHRLTHPRFGHRKSYLVHVQGHPAAQALDRLRKGVIIEGRRTRPAEVRRLDSPPAEFGPDPTTRGQPTAWLYINLGEGRKRQIRHMGDEVGHPVLRLIRVAIGPLRLGGLESGQWRRLTIAEVKQLRRACRLDQKNQTSG